MSPLDYEACNNLKRIYLQEKTERGVTQKDIEASTGILQVNISQHINARRAMEAGTVLKYASFFDISPGEIDQRLAEFIPEGYVLSGQKKGNWAPVLNFHLAIAWRDGNEELPKSTLKLAVNTNSQRLWAMELKSNRLAPRYVPGDIFVYDPDTTPNPGDLSVFEIDGEWIVGYFTNQNGNPGIAAPHYPVRSVDDFKKQFIARICEVIILSPSPASDF